MMRLAVLADIHGNLPALEAVVADVEHQRPDHVIVAGDLINSTPFSVEVVEFIMRRDWLVIRGNHEFYYLDFNSPRVHPDLENPSRWRALHQLNRIVPEHLGNYLAVLPDDLSLKWPSHEPLRVVHGMPGDPRAAVFPFTTDEQASELLAGVVEHTVVTAHTHIPGERQVARKAHAPSALSPNPPFKEPELRAGHWHIINPGSVGLPLNGDPGADYAILDSMPGAEEGEGWAVTFRKVPYNREKTLRAYFDRGEFRTGGAIVELFYWEVVSAQPEIIEFFSWARRQGLNSRDIDRNLALYKQHTGRDTAIEAIDPTGLYKSAAFRHA